MAYGFKFARPLNGGTASRMEQYLVSESGANALYSGAPVKLVAGYIDLAAPGEAVIGIFAGATYINTDGTPVFTKGLLAGQDSDGIFEGYDVPVATVIPVRGNVFTVETDAAITQAGIGKFYNFNAGTDDTSLKLSQATLDVASATTTSTDADLLVHRIINNPNNTGTNVDVEVEFIDRVAVKASQTLSSTVADVSTANSTAYFVAPFDGFVTEIQTVLKGAIATADADLTAKIAGTAITGGVVTISFTGSAAGDVDSATPTAANAVSKGDLVTVLTDGASTNAIAAEVFVTFQAN